MLKDRVLRGGIAALSGVILVTTLRITLLTKSLEPSSRVIVSRARVLSLGLGCWGSNFRVLECRVWVFEFKA